jgi:DNA-binding MarR family transcriptional regulator
MTSPVLVPDTCNCLAVRSAARHITQLYDEFLAPVGLRSTQFSILAKLKRKGRFTINALAKEMVMDRSTLARNIQPLERDGLIAVGPAADDRRAKEISLTKTGEKRLEAGVKGWAAAQAQFESSFGSKQTADLRAMLWSVVENPLGMTA